MMDFESVCVVCQSPTSQKCSGCHNVYYCSRAHQKQVWKEHKQICKPFKICENETLGRHLVATRSIPAGEIVLKEQALIAGPAQITAPVCLGCLQILRASACVACRACGWPMCSEKCRGIHVKRPECIYTQQRGQKISIKEFVLPNPSYQGLTILRMLYQRDHNKEIWDKLLSLQAHTDERKHTEKYKNDKIMVAQFIRNFFKLETKFTEDEIMNACGILQVNGHEVPLTEPPHVAIYEQTSLLEHNCRPNCYKTFTSNCEILIIAAVPIKAGEHLSICYADSLWGTENRRHYLSETKFFNCMCVRCSDPEEFGTWFSALNCQEKDCPGFVLPKTFLSEKSWICNKCGKILTSTTVQNILERIGKDLNAMQKADPKSCELFLNYYGKLLHPNHFYLTDVRLALAQFIGQEENGLSSVSEEDLQLKIKLCTQIIELVNILNKGEVRLRGSMLFELNTALAEITKRKANSNKFSGQELHNMLIESKTNLQKIIRLLQHEPEELPEGKILIQAKKNLIELEYVLKKLKEQ